MNSVLSSSLSPPSFLILGCGYVGNAVKDQFPDARFTHRNIFDLNNRKTWSSEVLSVAPGGTVLWTFPAASTLEEEALAVELYETFFQGLRVVVYGSTSAYRVQQEDEWVTEETELDLGQIRARTEEKLREKGACILHLAGIFGPGRDPLRWYERGLIQAGLSYLNLIHVQDIVSVTAQIANRKTLDDTQIFGSYNKKVWK